jgi:anhydro-N-acetylmuramic acid kinase
MPEYDYFLNIGGIANISVAGEPPLGGWGFDICPANRVLNMLANENGKSYDDEGKMASSGNINAELLEKLNALDYYKKSYPKSLANDFGTDVFYKIIKSTGISISDALRTYCEHIAVQIKNAIQETLLNSPLGVGGKLLTTGGGAYNKFLVQLFSENLKQLNIEVVVPDANLVEYKEALIMAFIGVLRWRQENNVLSSVTGAARDSIGGAIWTGQEA